MSKYSIPKTKDELITLIARCFYYLQTGQGLAGLVISLMNFGTLTYYEIIIRSDSLLSIFPSFISYLIVVVVPIPVIFVLLGYWFKKKSPFYKRQQDVDVEANPYTYHVLPPVSVECWSLMVELADELGIDSSRVQALLERSKAYQADKAKKLPKCEKT